MLRRNIDVTLGLVNGSIGTVEDVILDIDDRTFVKQLRIRFSHGVLYNLDRISTKFEVLSRAYVHRHQFPICLAYAITIHKSQGLSLSHALIDVGSSIFTCGQSYVALSRVTSIDGVHLINFDSMQVKAKDSAIVEYNRLRSLYRPDLSNLARTRIRVRKVKDRAWVSIPITDKSEDSHSFIPVTRPTRAPKRKSTASYKSPAAKKR